MSSRGNFGKSLILLSLSLSLLHCSGVRFNNAPTKTGTQAVDNGTSPGGVPGSGDTPAAFLPKVQFVGPPCERQTQCTVTFKLDKSYPSRTEFDWNTNDSLYGTPPPTGLAPWGKPGNPGDPTAQYVPTSGHVVFPPGQTEVTVYVQNINQSNNAISIGVQMSKCIYGALYESCQKFFNQ